VYRGRKPVVLGAENSSAKPTQNTSDVKNRHDLIDESDDIILEYNIRVLR
jgi:hypothetical protein